jgi:hypothetical protein
MRDGQEMGYGYQIYQPLYKAVIDLDPNLISTNGGVKRNQSQKWN